MALGTALAVSAIAGAGASAYAGNKASKAATQGAQQGADAMLQATRESNALQQQMFDTAWNAGAPWRAAGQQALGSLQSFMGMTPANAASYSQPTSGGVPGGSATTPSNPTLYPNTPTPVSGAPGGAMQGGWQVGPVNIPGNTFNGAAAGSGASGGDTANPSYASATPWMDQNAPLTNIDFTYPGSIRVSGGANMPTAMRTSMQQDGGFGSIASNPEGLAASNPGVSGGPQAPQPVYAPQTQNPAPTSPQAPISGGQGAPVDPNAGFNQFLNSTNYQFTRGEGENALTRLLARTGHLGSGRGQRAALELGQNMAHSNAIMPYMNQLNLMSGLGQNSAMMGGNQAMQLGGMMGNNIMQGGAAAGNALMQGGANRASAYANTGNAISNLFNQYGMWRGYQAGLIPGGP